MKIISQCKKALIQSTSLEENSTSETLDKRLEDLDAIIDIVNTMEYPTLVELELPPIDECVFSLCMLKEKKVAMQVVQDEFDRVIKDINNFRTKWNYLGRFSVPSFWNEENWEISWQRISDQLKVMKHDRGCLATLGEELVSSSTVVNELCKDFTILFGVNKIIQNLPATKNQIRSC